MAKWRPFGDGSMLIRPFQMGGITDSGIKIQHHENLPIVYGKVLDVHASCRYVRVGDWVLFLPGRPDRLTSREGALYSLNERSVLGIVEPGDGKPWFFEEGEERGEQTRELGIGGGRTR